MSDDEVAALGRQIRDHSIATPLSEGDMKVLASFMRVWNVPLSPERTMNKLLDHLSFIQWDDELLAEERESIPNMSTEELIDACEERGLRTDLEKDLMALQLQAWLGLSSDASSSSSSHRSSLPLQFYLLFPSLQFKHFPTRVSDGGATKGAVVDGW